MEDSPWSAALSWGDAVSYLWIILWGWSCPPPWVTLSLWHPWGTHHTWKLSLSSVAGGLGDVSCAPLVIFIPSPLSYLHCCFTFALLCCPSPRAVGWSLCPGRQQCWQEREQGCKCPASGDSLGRGVSSCLGWELPATAWPLRVLLQPPEPSVCRGAPTLWICRGIAFEVLYWSIKWIRSFCLGDYLWPPDPKWKLPLASRSRRDPRHPAHGSIPSVFGKTELFFYSLLLHLSAELSDGKQPLKEGKEPMILYCGSGSAVLLPSRVFGVLLYPRASQLAGELHPWDGNIWEPSDLCSSKSIILVFPFPKKAFFFFFLLLNILKGNINFLQQSHCGIQKIHGIWQNWKKFDLWTVRNNREERKEISLSKKQFLSLHRHPDLHL